MTFAPQGQQPPPPQGRAVQVSSLSKMEISSTVFSRTLEGHLGTAHLVHFSENLQGLSVISLIEQLHHTINNSF